MLIDTYQNATDCKAKFVYDKKSGKSVLKLSKNTVKAHFIEWMTRVNGTINDHIREGADPVNIFIKAKQNPNNYTVSISTQVRNTDSITDFVVTEEGGVYFRVKDTSFMPLPMTKEVLAAIETLKNARYIKDLDE